MVGAVTGDATDRSLRLASARARIGGRTFDVQPEDLLVPAGAVIIELASGPRVEAAFGPVPTPVVLERDGRMLPGESL